MPRYTDEELHAMEHDPDEWDWDNPQVLPPSPEGGLRVTLDLSSDEVRAMSAAAVAAGTTLPRFIRTAALEKAHATTPTTSSAVRSE